MGTIDNNKQVVLSCIDGSSVSCGVCDYASWIASKIAAPVKLLHTISHRHDPAVSDFSGAIGLGSQEDLLNELTELEQNRGRLLIKKGQLMLEAAKKRVLKAGIEKITMEQRHGSLAGSLVDLEDEIRVMVMGIRGEEHELDEKGFGTKLESVIRSLHKPMLIVGKDFTQPKNFMLAYDGSSACKKALDMVASSALFKDISCHLVHVGDKAEAMLDEAAEVLQAAGLEVTTAQIQGKVRRSLSQYQTDNDIDMTVMGAFGHNRFRHFLVGSFTAKMLACTQKPLLLLR